MKKLKRVVPFVLMLVMVAGVLPFAACGGGDGASAVTPFEQMQGRLTALESWQGTINQWKGGIPTAGEMDSISSDITQLRLDVEALDGAGDYSGEIAAILESLDGLEARLAEIEAGGNPGGGSLEIALLSQLPVIVNDGTYLLTVRVTNTDVSPDTGRIVLQLHAYSGALNVASCNVTGSPPFMAAEFDPIRTAASTITLYSESIVIGASSSRIYQFSVVLAQGGAPFEWIPVMSVAN